MSWKSFNKNNNNLHRNNNHNNFNGNNNFRNNYKSNSNQPRNRYQADFLDEVLRNGPSIIRSESDAMKLFQAALRSEDEIQFMFKIDNEMGMACLKRTYSLGLSSDNVFNNGLIKFFEFLGQDNLNQGTVKSCTEKCYLAAFETPGFMKALLESLKKEDSTSAYSVIAWFLVSIAKCSHEAREHPTVIEIATFLSSKDKNSVIQQLLTVLYPVTLKMSSDGSGSSSSSSNHRIDPESITSLDELKALEPCHDNDFPFDYRKISIVPTAAEINFHGASSSGMKISWSSQADDKPLVEASLLDRQFRLLREDMIAPVKEELRTELSSDKNDNRRLFKRPTVVGILSRPKPTILIQVETPPALFGRIRHLNEKEVKIFFSEVGRRVLGKESMVLFIIDKEVKFVGVITLRDEKTLCTKDHRHLIVGVNFLDNHRNFVDFLSLKHTQMGQGGKTHPVSFASSLFQASSSLFAYQPVLERLQDMTAVPFSEQIAHRNKPVVLGEEHIISIPEDVMQNLRADTSQLEASLLAMNHNITIVQGPPGTGKTYVGIQMAKSLLSSPTKERILCLCYTNHALDSFLESLLDNGIRPTNIVRLGRSPKISDRLKSRCLNELSETQFDRNQTMRYAKLKKQQEQIESDIELKKKEILDFRPFGSGSWYYINKYFNDNYSYHIYLEAFTMPNNRSRGFQIVGSKGKGKKEDHLWRTWFEGKSMPDIVVSNESNLNIWSYSKDKRRALVQEWNNERKRGDTESLAASIQSLNKITSEIEILRSETKRDAIANALIIGCTTTSAAKNFDLLNHAKPTCIIVEEAGEILEAHVLTTVFNSVRRIILIGDHLQLSPKLEHFPLRKDSGKHIDFDVSLFERLITQSEDFPYVTLNIQHRMRPEISMIIRHMTYPNLIDHPTVMNRKHILGLKSDVIFISHNQGESSDEDRLALGTSSKVNIYESDMVVMIAKYLLMQSYTFGDIVILTPYLGQLVMIQKALSKANLEVDIGDLDRGELVKANVDLVSKNSQRQTKASNIYEEKSIKVTEKLPDGDDDDNDNDSVDDEDEVDDEEEEKKTASSHKSAIRVATIDNFQGEEAKIIIGSLVRSNDDGDIGFMSSAERVNVFCSRARDGFIIVGDSSTYRNARSVRGRELWNKLMDKFKNEDYIFAGLPIKCQNHQTEGPMLSSVADLLHHCPEGGCNLPCNMPLPSCPLGHKCQRICHAIIDPKTKEDVHNHMLCTFIISDSCKNGHSVDRICSRSSPNICHRQVEVTCIKGHIIFHKCHKTAPPCNTCLIIEKKRKTLDYERQVESIKEARKLQEAEESNLEAEIELCAELKRKSHQLMLHRIRIEEGLKRRKISELIAERSQAIDYFIDEFELPIDRRIISSSVVTSQSAKTIELNAPVNNNELVDNDTSWTENLTNSNQQLISESSLPLKSHLAADHMAEPVLVSQSTEPSVSQLCSVLKSMGNGSYLQAFELLRPQSNSSLIIDILLMIAKLFLGQNPVENVVELEEIKLKAKSMGVYPRSTMESYEYTTLILHLALSLSANKLGDTPETAGQHALYYLNGIDSVPQSSSDKSSIEIIQSFPASWKQLMTNITNSASAVVSEESSSRSNQSEGLKQWLIIKESNEYGTANSCQSIDKLMFMIGLETVKRFFIEQFHKISISKEQNVPVGQASYNARFDGNPGTGKTNVARLYASFLIEIEVLPKGSLVIETSGATLVSGRGVDVLKKHFAEIEKVGGGVIFLDEAYQLNPKEDREGRQVLDFILTFSEKLECKHGSIVWIFAGYADRMEKLFEHNPGLPSRFPCHLVFNDYSDEELLEIFSSILANGGRDKSVSTELPSQAPVPPKQSPSINMSSANGYSNIYMHKANEVDKWGNIWKWNSTQYTFEDSFNNITGYGVANLGTTSNPVISRNDNSQWIYNDRNKLWQNLSNPSMQPQTEFPGHPKTKKASEPTPVEPFTVSDEKWSRIAIQRLGKQRGKVGFGNARSVRILFDRIRQRQASRLAKLKSLGFTPDVMLFERDDLLGPRADRTSLQASEAYHELLAMEGLQSVKDKVENFLELVMQNAQREEDGKKMIEVSLNYVFLGNPGTGKTTVAKLFGRILADLGLLSKGDVIIKNPSDFIGSALGTSEQQTRAILQSAEGCVLVIDEAYLLNSSAGSGGGGGMGIQDPYKAAVIDTIVEQVQGRPGDDRSVLLLGYRNEMEAMFSSCNPGLSRRFQLENAFIFEDYNDDSLLRILMASCKKDELKISLELGTQAIKKLLKAKEQPNFGNAGSVNNLLTNAKLKLQQRQSKLPRYEQNDELVASDFDIHENQEVTADDIFNGLVGFDQVIAKLKEYQNLIKLCKEEGRDPRNFIEFNFTFTGAPGTGKTTIARRMGKMFHSLGLLPNDDVIETSVSDFLTGYAGQSGKKTKDIFRKARGKVLFIDEAYRLNPTQGGPFMQEVVDEIVQQLTSEEYKGRLIVILAGYESDINDMLNVNQGLRSRFSENLHFDNFTVDMSIKLLMQKIQSGISSEFSQEAINSLPELVNELIKLPSFGNGRDIETLAKRVIRNFANRRSKKNNASTDCNQISDEDVSNACRDFVLEKRSANDNDQHKSSTNRKQPQQQQQSYDVRQHQPITNVKATTAIVESKTIDVADDSMEDAHETSTDGVFLKELQNIIDEMGLNSAKGVDALSQYDTLSAEFIALINELVLRSNGMLNYESARDKLVSWQSAQEDVRDKMEEQEKEMELAKAQKRKALLPIWRCGVCGRADKPYIACYVQPFIVRYQECDI